MKRFLLCGILALACGPALAGGPSGSVPAGLQPANNLSDLSSISQAQVNLGVLPISGGTLTGALTVPNIYTTGTYSFSGAMTPGAIPYAGNYVITGTPGPLAGYNTTAPWALTAVNGSAPTSGGLNILSVRAVTNANTVGVTQSGLFSCVQNAAPATSSGYNNSCVGVQELATAFYNSGGSGFVNGNTAEQNFNLTSGYAIGGNPQTIIYPNATYLRQAVGDQVNFAVQTSAAAAPAQNFGLSIGMTSSSLSRGVFDDAYFVMGRQSGTTATGKNGVLFGATTFDWPFASDSTMIGVQPRIFGCGGGRCNIAVAQYGVNFSGVTFTAGGAAFASPGFSVDPSGNIIGASVTSAGAVSGSALTATGLVSAAYVGTNSSGQLIPASAPGTGVSSFNTRSGAVTLTSADVSSVYTPPVTSVDTLTGSVVTEHCDTFTGSGTWTKQSWATQVSVDMLGGGGAGGNGGTDPGSSITSGGGGGGGGFHKHFAAPASGFTSSSAVTIGAGGTSGAQGGFTSFGGRYAYGGGAGANGASGGVAAASGAGAGTAGGGGNASGATPGTGGSGGQAGSATTVTALVVPGQPTAGGPGLATGASSTSAPTNDGPTGGGSGGGLAATAASITGGPAAGPDGYSGVTGGAAAAAGGAGVPVNGFVGTGGSGGGSNASGVGGAGGAGVNGGGGGGGGAGTSGGGTGGAGGSGVALVCQRATG